MKTGVTLIAGKPFFGKTARLLHELEDEPRVLLFDGKLGELTTLKGYTHWDNPADFVPCLRWMKDNPERSCRAVFHVRHEQPATLERVCSLLPHVKNLVLAIDECSLFVPVRAALGQWTRAMFTSGTHDGIRVIGTVQCPRHVHIDARALAGRWILYCITEGQDLDLLRGMLSQYPALRDALPCLPEHVCIDVAHGSAPYLDRSFVGKLGGYLPPRPL